MNVDHAYKNLWKSINASLESPELDGIISKKDNLTTRLVLLELDVKHEVDDADSYVLEAKKLVIEEIKEMLKNWDKDGKVGKFIDKLMKK